MMLTSYTIREVRRRPGRTILTLLGIVIGVQALVAIPLTIQTTRHIHRALFEGITGRATLEVVPFGRGGFAPGLSQRVEEVEGVAAAVPVIQSTAAIWGPSGLVPVMILGIDLERDHEARDYALRRGSLLTSEDGVLLEVGVAESLGYDVGATVRLLAPSGTTSVEVVGLLEPRGAAAVNGGAVAILPLATAQRLYGLEGQVNSLNLVLAEEADPDEVADRVSKHLPPGLTVQTPANRAALAHEGLVNTERMLAILSVGSLVAGAFVILNSFLMNLGERRRALAILRALGATRRQVTRLLFSEAVLLSVIGTALGVPIGVGAAWVITHLMAQLSGAVAPQLHVTAGPFLLAGLLGPGVAMLATYLPARKAARRSPLAELRGRPGTRLASRERGRDWPGYVGLGMLAAFGLVYVVILTGRVPSEMFIYIMPVGMVLTLVGCALAIPMSLIPLSRLAQWLLRPILGIEASLAIRQLRRHPTRTSLVVGVLTISVILSIGYGNSILNSVRHARGMMVRVFANIDFLIFPTALSGTEILPVSMPEAYADRVSEMEGVRLVGMGNIFAARAQGYPVQVFARTCGPGEDPGFRFVGEDDEEIRRGLRHGEVVIGTTLGQRAGLGPGEQISITTRAGMREFTIAGLTPEYSAGGLLVLIEWDYAKQYFDLEGVRYIYVTAVPEDRVGADRRLRSFCEEHGLLMHSRAEFTATCDKMIAGAISSAWVLLALVFVVASLGITNFVTMNVLEQTREIGVLRAVAMTRRQVCKMILAQALAIGVISTLPGAALGALLGYAVSNATYATVGLPIPYVLEPGLLIGGVVVALVVAGLASLPPARRAGRMQIIRALQYE
jgi:putative ABC transport system permease protein